MAEHTIPQDVLGYEFKLFAGLTWRQFIYVAFGIGAGVLLLQSTAKGFIPALIGYPLGILAMVIPASISLVKIQGRTLESWLKDAMRVFGMPLVYAWNKDRRKIKLKQAPDSKPKVFPKYLKGLFEKGKIARGVNLRQHRRFVRQKLNKLILTPESAKELAVHTVKLAPIPNTIALLLATPDDKPITDVVGILQSETGQTIDKLRSNTKGILYFSKSVPNGVYRIILDHPLFKFPMLEVYFTGAPYPLVKIKAIDNAKKEK